jgi:dTDP-4-dehydrorhamnose 3,5-epimerase
MARVENLPGIEIFENDKFFDHRGELYTIWKKENNLSLNFNHDKAALSKNNVLRGLHTDKSWKLITCLHGKIQLVVLDLEKNLWTDFILDSSDEISKSILVPPGFYNGHLVLSDEAVFFYKWAYEGNYPDVDEQKSVNWSDNYVNIAWKSNQPILSNRDKNTPIL